LWLVVEAEAMQQQVAAAQVVFAIKHLALFFLLLPIQLQLAQVGEDM